MEMNKLTILMLMMIVTLSSCRKLVQDEFDDFESFITINSISEAGDSLKVYVSLTDEYNDMQLVKVANADIEIYNQNNDLLLLAKQAEGEYVFDYIVQENDTFNMIVNVPDYGQVSASCYVPQHSEILDAVVTENLWINDEGEACPNIKFKVLNDRSRGMYFYVAVRVFEKDAYSVDGFSFNNELVLSLFDNIGNNSDYIEQDINFARSGWSSSAVDYAYQIVLKSFDESTYHYLGSLEKYYEVSSPDFSTYSIIPTNFYSNVQNGYGVFGAYSFSISDTIK